MIKCQVRLAHDGEEALRIFFFGEGGKDFGGYGITGEAARGLLFDQLLRKRADEQLRRVAEIFHLRAGGQRLAYMMNTLDQEQSGRVALLALAQRSRLFDLRIIAAGEGGHFSTD